MKTTKEIHLICEESRCHDEISLEEYNLVRNQKWFSESDIEQLQSEIQKELKENIKLTKLIDELLQSNPAIDSRVTKGITSQINLCKSGNDTLKKRYSESDVEQLQKELKDKLHYYSDVTLEQIDEVFNNFKGSNKSKGFVGECPSCHSKSIGIDMDTNEICKDCGRIF